MRNQVAVIQNQQRNYSEDGEMFFSVLHSRMTDSEVKVIILLICKKKEHLIHIKWRIYNFNGLGPVIFNTFINDLDARLEGILTRFWKDKTGESCWLPWRQWAPAEGPWFWAGGWTRNLFPAPSSLSYPVTLPHPQVGSWHSFKYQHNSHRLCLGSAATGLGLWCGSLPCVL